jgi:hypothetical protein
MTRWTILTLSQKWVKLLKYSSLYHRPLLAPVSDIRGRIYNSFVGGIIVQPVLSYYYMNVERIDNFNLEVFFDLIWFLVF